MPTSVSCSATWLRWSRSGFTDQPVLELCLLLGEEVGEVFKAVRKQTRMRLEPASVTGTVDEELADVLILVCAIANRLGIDLPTAFRAKEDVNESRSWS